MSSATVLVVDDDPTLTTLVCAALEEEGYRVVSAVGYGRGWAGRRGWAAPLVVAGGVRTRASGSV